MAYLTAKQFSIKWGITERRIIKLCNEKRIDGAIKNGMVWLIPEETMKPSDKRSKIAQYINTQKNVMVINIDNEIGYSLIPILKKEGFVINGIYASEVDELKTQNLKLWKINYKDTKQVEQVIHESNKYYDALIYIDLNENNSNKELLISEFSKKMNSESSIVLVNSIKNSKEKLEEKFSNKLSNDIGVRINSLNITVPIRENVLIDYEEISKDVASLLTNFRNTTGLFITTDGGTLEFDDNGNTKPLETGKFYKAINKYLKQLNKESYMWCASTMLEDEWTEEPLEMQFRVANLEAANKGVNIERIFIFSKNKIKEFKENKTLKIYMQSNIKTMFVDYDEIKEKEPKLLEIVGEGWDGIDKDTLILDLPEKSSQRGYITINKKEVQKAYDCFKKLKKYSKDLKEVLK